MHCNVPRKHEPELRASRSPAGPASPTGAASHTPADHVQVGLPLPRTQPPFHPLLVSQLRRSSDLAGHAGAVGTDVSEHGEHFQDGSGTEESGDGGAAEFPDRLGPPGD